MNTHKRVGWLTSARDGYAVKLLDDALHAKVGISVVVSDSRESVHLQRIRELCERNSIPFEVCDKKNFEPELRRRDRKEWRTRFDTEIGDRLRQFKSSHVLLCGYMSLVTEALHSRWDLFLNLHPAPPLGPRGKWEDVIWSLVATRARIAGAVLHVVTKELDAGPIVSYYTVPIVGDEVDNLWAELDRRLEDTSLDEISRMDGEENALFQEIRRRQFEREAPLMILTLRAIEEGKIRPRSDSGFVTDYKLAQPTGAVCLTAEVERFLKGFTRAESG